MKKLTTTVFIVFGFLAVLGCERVEFKNGQVPDKYLPLAQSLQGEYRGAFESFPYALNLSLDGNRPVMTLTARGARDCHFEIGDILNADVSEDSNGQMQIDHVVFELKGQTCFFLQGDEVELTFTQENDGLHAMMAILRSMDNRDECRMVGGTPGNPPHEICQPSLKTDYVIGGFTRH